MKNNLHLLLIFPSYAGKGGIQRFNRTLVRVSAELGMDMVVMSLVDEPNALRMATRGLNVRSIGMSGHRILFVLRVLWLLIGRRWDAVVVGHVNLARIVTAILPWGRSRSAKTMLIAHGIDVWGCISGRRAKAIGKMWRVLAVSEYTRQSVLNQVLKLKPSACVVFPNAVSESWQREQRLDPEDMRNLPKKYVLSVTRLVKTERYKGIVTAIESISSWRDQSLHYVIVGSGDDCGFLKRVAQRCGVAHRVVFMDRVSDDQLSAIYRNASVFLLASGKEGFGIVFLEAMSFGIPVVAARACGAVDVVRQNQTGILVDYGDVVVLTEAINRVVEDVVLRERLVVTGKALVTEQGEFTEKAMSLRWQTILSHAAQPEPRRSRIDCT